MRIWFAGGWTGWHVFPVQSLIKYINETKHGSHEFFWFGEKPSLEHNTYLKIDQSVEKLYFSPLLSWKRRREKGIVILMKNIIDLGKLGIWFFQSLFGLIYHKIDIIFCKWWYVSLPVVVAWWVLRKKILLHESDTKPGLSNRICSKFASVIFTWFEWVFPGKEIVVGQILDDDLVNSEFKIQNSELYKEKTNVLVTWGSQGSESIYKLLKDIIVSNYFDTTFFHIILGTRNNHLESLFSGLQNVKVYDFVDQKTMWWLLNICDVAITRGGTTSLAEEELFGIKKIIIPIPWTHDQLKNALYYEKNYDDVVVRQDSKIFAEDFEKAIGEYKEYKKEKYSNPLDGIHKTKDIILEYLLK